MARFTLYAVASLLLIASVAAYPTLWIEDREAVNNCLAHPTKSEGQHGAPVPDK